MTTAEFWLQEIVSLFIENIRLFCWEETSILWARESLGLAASSLPGGPSVALEHAYPAIVLLMELLCSKTPFLWWACYFIYLLRGEQSSTLVLSLLSCAVTGVPSLNLQLVQCTPCAVLAAHTWTYQLACSMSGHNTETKYFPLPKKILTCHSELNHGFFHLLHAKSHRSKILDLMRKEGYEITLICSHEQCTAAFSFLVWAAPLLCRVSHISLIS